MSATSIIDWLKTHWFVLSALVTGGVAWGQNVTKVAELESKVSRAEVIITNQARIDERTLILQQDMKEQKAILIELLTTQRAWAEKNRVVVPQAPVATPKVQQK